MAKIPTFTREVAATNQSQPFLRLTPPTENLRRAGEKLMNEGARIKTEEQQRADASWASKSAAEFRRAELQRFDEEKRNTTEIEDFNVRYMSSYDDRVEDLLGNAPTDRARELLERQMNSFGTGLQQSALGFEAQQRVSKRFGELADTLDEMANNAATNPALYEIEMEGARLMIEESASDLPPDKQSALKTMADNRITRGYLKGLIAEDPAYALQRLEDGAHDEQLSAANREALVSAANTEIRRLEALAEAERRERYMQIKDVIKENVDVLAAGHDAAQLDGVDEALTALGGSEELELRALWNNAKDIGSKTKDFVLLPPTAQQDVINTMEQQLRGRKVTPQDLDLLDAFRKAADYRDRAVKSDALSYAVEVGLISDYDSLDFTNAESLRMRGIQARRLESHFGSKAMPFTDTEMQMFVDVYDEGDILVRQQLMTKLAEEWSPSLIKKFAQKIGPNNPTLAYATAISTERPALTRLIMKGQQKIDQLPEFRQSREDYRATFAEELGGMFTEQPEHHRMIIDSALAVYTERSGGEFDENGPNTEQMQEAIRLVLGGDIVGGRVVGGDLRYNGVRVVSPVKGMTQDQWESGIENLQDIHVMRYGQQWNPVTEEYNQVGGPVLSSDAGEEVTAEDIRRHGTFRAVGDGKYLVAYSDGFLQNQNGQPYIIDLKSFFNAGATFTQEDLNYLTGQQ
jgi:hypothetical protein